MAARKQSLAELFDATATSEYYDEGDYIRAVRADMSKRTDKLPAEIFTIDKSDTSGLRFKRDEPKFQLPSVLFGTKVHRIHDTIMADFKTNFLVDTKTGKWHLKKNAKSLGTILVGDKGCGKSQQAEYMCNTAIEKAGLPIIRIDKAYTLAVVKEAIKTAGPCVVYIDEYEKLYKNSRMDNNLKHGENGDVIDEDELLTLFSDKSLKGVLFIITSNSRHKLSQYIVNRPERFKYCIDYRGVDSEVVKEVCASYKLEKGISDYICDYMEDSESSIDTAISLASSSVGFKNIDEMKELFDILNVPAPKIWQWIIYTKTGEAEGLKVKTDRKKIFIEADDGEKWEVDDDTFWKKLQWNQMYRCFVLKGLGGESGNIKYGIRSAGPAKADDETAEPYKFYQLEAPQANPKFG